MSNINILDYVSQITISLLKTFFDMKNLLTVLMIFLIKLLKHNSTVTKRSSKDSETQYTNWNAIRMSSVISEVNKLQQPNNFDNFHY